LGGFLVDFESALLEQWFGPYLAGVLQDLFPASAPGGSPSLFQSFLDQQDQQPASPSDLSPNDTGPQGSPGAPALDAAFSAAAQATGLSPALLKAVAQQESGFQPEAVSSAGAIGVMQLMPATAAELGVDPYNAAENIMGGARYLAALLHQFGSLPLALAAYNAGPGAVEAYRGIPPYQETQRYVASIEAHLTGPSLSVDA
jgi:soluble lytic murein transglycosylase-like protein